MPKTKKKKTKKIKSDQPNVDPNNAPKVNLNLIYIIKFISSKYLTF